ncbi:MAG: RNA methyltransferase [Candidatus Omnitrophica bacterium]|nr:RNA methyltransferase [Candidatus Omnitrophota bacterium]
MARDFMVLYGRNSIIERLKVNPESIRKVFLQDNFDAPGIVDLIKAKNVSVEYLSLPQLSKMRQDKDLQGMVARVDRFRYTPVDVLLNQPKDAKSTIIFLDRLTDPHNLGVIIRTAACFGGFSIVIPEFQACEVNETVLHVASGGENHISIAMVPNIASIIRKAKNLGYWIMGAVVKEDAGDITNISLPFPLGLVLGSEGGGIRYGVDKLLDIKAHIPMKGAKLSFNVNMACAIFCHEICKQRGG